MFDSLLKVLPFAGDLLGGVLGKNQADKAAESAQLQAIYNVQQQERFAKEGIRWRVDDAKAAGLHPLYAIQGSGATFNPNPIFVPSGPDYSSMGQNLGRAAQAAITAGERESLNRSQQDLVDQQIRESRSREQLNIVQAQAVASKAALDEQSQWTEFPGPGPYTHLGQATPKESHNTAVPGQFTSVPHEIISQDPKAAHKLAGPAEARWKEAQVGPGGTRLLLPHQGGQFQEDMTIADAPSWVAANVQRYGWNRFLGAWLAGRERLVETYRWDRPLVDAIQRFIDRNSNVRR